MILAFAILALGALIIFAQSIEWWTFGNWNPVSVRYALGYFEIQPRSFTTQKFLDFPLSMVFLAISILIAAIGVRHARRTAKKARQKSI
jgi:uncharacterized membrane protein SirB2